MMLALLIGGIGAVVAGLLAILYGFLIDLSFGNTLIVAGAVGVSTGMILLGLAAVVLELRGIARRLGAGVPAEPRVRPMLPPGALVGPSEEGRLVAGDQSAPEPTRAEPAMRPPPPWEEAPPVRDRPRAEAPSEPETGDPAAAPGPRQRRNLLFASNSRRERERAQARATDAPPAEERPALGEPPQAGEAPPVTFEDAWPKPERRSSEPPPWRAARKPSALSEPSPTAAIPERPAAGSGEGQPEATVLKSGVVDGMAYSLYSDGSIEAQMPEGMMRFASIDELRSHLDQKS